jgi:hypothetical protein
MDKLWTASQETYMRVEFTHVSIAGQELILLPTNHNLRDIWADVHCRSSACPLIFASRTELHGAYKCYRLERVSFFLKPKGFLTTV